MAASEDHRTPHEIIKAEREAYLDALPSPDPDWPVDVRVMHDDISAHLFSLGLRIRDVKSRCGIGDNNISSRFRYFVGRAPKDFVLHHRCVLAQQLLVSTDTNVCTISLELGWSNPVAFVNAFEDRVGCSPSGFRRKARES